MISGNWSRKQFEPSNVWMHLALLYTSRSKTTNTWGLHEEMQNADRQQKHSDITSLGEMSRCQRGQSTLITARFNVLSLWATWSTKMNFETITPVHALNTGMNLNFLTFSLVEGEQHGDSDKSSFSRQEKKCPLLKTQHALRLQSSAVCCGLLLEITWCDILCTFDNAKIRVVFQPSTKYANICLKQWSRVEISLKLWQQPQHQAPRML